MSFQRQITKTNRNRIGILGGTFNPVHLGHIEMAKQVHEQFGLNDIWIMPSGDPSSYKDGSEVISSMHRCNMVNLAIQPFSYMKLSTIEVEKKGLTYTADTLKILYPSFDKIYFIIGADSLFGLPKWNNCSYVMSHCSLLVADRKEYSHSALTKQKELLTYEYNADINFIDMKQIPVSSTQIRHNISNNVPITGLVPEKVEQYIYNNHLYS